MGTRAGPWQWMCSWCRVACTCFRWTCSCLPDICPRNPDRLKVEEVTAEDYINEKKKVLEGRIGEDNIIKATLRSCGGYITGLLLTTIYAFIVLFIKHYNLWYCVVSTVTLGAFLSIGMAFSARVRCTVFLLLPQLFSGEAKAIVLFIAFTLALQGPTTNTMENFNRVSQSASCSIELTMNQTRDIMEKVKRPLLSALNDIRSIGQKLHNVSNRAKKFFKSLTDAVKHIGNTLRSIWAFISSMGDVCNHELEGPYRKCTRIFDEGKENCFKVMSFMGFLCYIVDVFRPLCGVSKVLIVFCLIPNYLQRYVKKYMKNPVVTALRNIKEQFEFNLTVIHDFDFTVNSSKTHLDIANSIKEEIQEQLDPFLEALSMFSYSMMFICIYSYIKALSYRKNYLFEDTFDNIYITRKFIELDVMRARSYRSTLLPLSPREAYGFIRPGSLALTSQEKKGYSLEIINVFRSLLIVTLLVLVDYIVFWVLDMVAYLLRAEVVARAPRMMEVFMNGTGYASEIFSSVVAAFNILQKSNITILSKKCALRPSPPDFRGYLLIGLMYGMAFFIAICGIYIQRLKHAICAYYYPSREQERICFLYNDLLTKRLHTETALLNCIRVNAEDKGQRGCLLVLATKCPGFRCIAQFLGINQQYCMGCAKICTGPESQGFLPCITSGCKGLYCSDCFVLMKGVCPLCMAPLVYSEDADEEVDSSDEEKVHLWMDAMKKMREDEKAKKRTMKKVIKKEKFRRQGPSDQLLQKYTESVGSRESGEESSGLSDVDRDQDSGDTDFEYQDKSDASSISDQEDWLIPRAQVNEMRLRPSRRQPIRDEEKGYGPA